MFTFNPTGVCSKQIMFDVVDGKLTHVKFVGGCPGNTTGVGKLVEGMPVEQVIEKLEGIKCRPTTSCPGQLAQALKKYLEQNKK